MYIYTKLFFLKKGFGEELSIPGNEKTPPPSVTFCCFSGRMDLYSNGVGEHPVVQTSCRSEGTDVASRQCGVIGAS